jgi:TatD DNase family protein
MSSRSRHEVQEPRGTIRFVIDTHCHLDGVENPVEAASHLTALVTIGFNPTRARSCLVLAETLSNVYCTVGLHPTDANMFSPEVTADLEGLARHEKVVGIGESGVDYYWDAAPKSVQITAFEWQLELARRLDKAIVIHTRDKDGQRQAFADCAATLERAGWHKGILHCFAGDAALLEVGLRLGFHVSFAGNLTYKNAQVIRDAAARVPLERLLVETDAPYLAPVPHRGQKNRPEFVRFTLETLAEVRGVSFADMERITQNNARAVYGLPA